jgi:polo-like kinase 1
MNKDSSTENLPKVIIEKIQKPNGEPTFKHYTKGFLLGKGAFAKVYKMTCSETNEQFAGKVISKSYLLKNRARQKLMSEIKVHRTLHHSNIVQFCNYFEDEDHLYILVELCTNQTLSDLIRRRKRITELEAQCYLFQLIQAMKYLHGHRVIHRDIKLANILISESMEVKLGDFGLAAKLEYDGERKRTICGTPNYMAPEILDGKFGHSYECDVWSFGVLLYTLLVGKPPFETGDVKMTYRRIKLNLYTFPENIAITPEAKALITVILNLDYTKRPTFDEILSSDFFTRNIIPKLLPNCVLAIPPSQGYVKQFESRGRKHAKEPSIVRSSTLDNVSQPSTPSPRSERPHSRDPERPLYSETKGVPFYSAFVQTLDNGPQVWVKSWIDYTNKYGLGYLLSTNWLGVLFNDKTKIISNLTYTKMIYINISREGENNLEFSIDSYPQELYKKVMLTQLFRKHLGIKSLSSVEDQNFYLKSWIRTPHAVLFRLSNKIIQVCFNDRSELIFSNISKSVVYIKKDGECSSHPMNNALELGDRDLVKRLKYSKDVLLKMLQGTRAE